MTPYPNEAARADFTLAKKYSRLVGAAAINDTSQGLAVTPLEFYILADGQELWRSKPLQRMGEWEPFDADVAGVEQLQLVVKCNGSNEYCHAVWIDPILDPSGSWSDLGPRTLSKPETQVLSDATGTAEPASSPMPTGPQDGGQAAHRTAR